jgi:hypothetical protein
MAGSTKIPVLRTSPPSRPSRDKKYQTPIDPFVHLKLPLDELFAAVEPGSAGWLAAPEITLASFLLNGHGPQCLRLQNQLITTHGNLE